MFLNLLLKLDTKTDGLCDSEEKKNLKSTRQGQVGYVSYVWQNILCVPFRK